MKKEEIYAKLASMKQYVEEEGRKLSDEATVEQYQELVYEKEGKKSMDSCDTEGFGGT